MRFFLGTKIDESLIKAVSKVRNSFRDLDADIKAVKDENLHLTVKFLGEIDEEELERIDCIREALADFQPFELELKDVGVFPSRDYIKVIWAGAGKGREKFAELMSEIENRTREEGFEKDENDPVPHVTIGRVKSGRNKQLIQSELDEWKGKTFGQMLVDRVTLFKSKLTPKGPVYEKIKDYEL
ncbi:MAG: RNA 2',3'-cyclic phosphodiesterase [Candidatus Aenigmatarchaeota archaeon]